MKNLKGACIFGQSGGPSSVINSSAAGVFLTALKEDCITFIVNMMKQQREGNYTGELVEEMKK